MTTATSRYFALLALTAALWGAQPLLVKITMRELNPSTMTAVRYLLMSITFFALMRWRGLPLLPPLRLMPALLLMGITGVALNNIAQFTGLQLSTVSNATLIATTTPAVTALVALIFLRERLLPIELLGILLSVAGALFLVSKGQIDVLLHISFNKGDLLFFTAQLGWAVYSLTGFRVMRHLPPLTTTAWAGLFGTAGTFIYAALTGQLDVHSVGGTTLALDQLNEGDCLHDFVGPLGEATHVEDLGRVAVHLDEQDGGGVAGQTGPGEVVHADNGVVVEKFQRAGDNVRGDDARHGFGGFLNVVEYGHDGLGSLGRRHKLEHRRGNDAQRSLGLDHHAAEIVAGDALYGAGAGLDQCAGGVEEFDAHEVVLGDAVFQAAQSARVFRDVAADGGYAL